MKTYFIGYEHPTDVHLTLFTSAEDADYNSEEWCAVDAESLKEAEANYETAFLKWKQQNENSNPA